MSVEVDGGLSALKTKAYTYSVKYLNLSRFISLHYMHCVHCLPSYCDGFVNYETQGAYLKRIGLLAHSHTKRARAHPCRPTFRENQPLSRTMRVRPFHLFINHTSYARTPTQMPAEHSYIWYIRDSHARASSKLPSACECVVRRRISFRAGEMERRRCLSV